MAGCIQATLQTSVLFSSGGGAVCATAMNDRRLRHMRPGILGTESNCSPSLVSHWPALTFLFDAPRLTAFTSSRCHFFSVLTSAPAHQQGAGNVCDLVAYLLGRFCRHIRIYLAHLEFKWHVTGVMSNSALIQLNLAVAHPSFRSEGGCCVCFVCVWRLVFNLNWYWDLNLLPCLFSSLSVAGLSYLREGEIFLTWYKVLRAEGVTSV